MEGNAYFLFRVNYQYKGKNVVQKIIQKRQCFCVLFGGDGKSARIGQRTFPSQDMLWEQDRRGEARKET